MTLRLILTRHAKSNWDDPRQDDHDRPLNKRGRKSASALGDWMARHGHLPGEVLCSSAERTRETWARIAARMPNPPEVTVAPALYLAEPDGMLAVLKNAAEQVVMMLGHNPGTAFLAEALVAQPPADSRFHHYPTASTTVIDFDAAHWGDVAWSSGRAVEFIVPRDLL